MSAPRFAARLLSLPGFADEAEFRLGEAAERADAIRAALDAAEARLRLGEAAKRVAFDLVVDQPAVQTLAAFAEVGAADRVYLHTALETPSAVRAAVDPLVARLDGLPGLQAGLGEAVPGLSEVRLIGPRFDGRLDFDGRQLELTAEPPSGQRAIWAAVQRALCHAVGSNVEAYGCQVDGIEHHAELSVGLELDIAVRPRRSSLLGRVCAAVAAALDAAGLPEPQVRAAVRAIPAGFESWLYAWVSRKATAELQAADGPIPADREGRAHAARLRADVWRPVLGQPFALASIYVRPRGATGGRAPGLMRGEPEDSAPAAVIDMHRALDEWIARDDRADAIRVISGAPGAGKSSLARMYAAERSRAPGVTCYVPLHCFDLADDFREAIRRSQASGVDPFDARREPLLLILDGLDEFALRGPTAANSVGQLVDAVCRTVELLNQERIAMRAILLGRELVVQRIGDRFRRPGQIIELLPLHVEPGAYKRHQDPDGIRDVDQRHVWWRRYGELTGEPLDGVPPELQSEAFAPLTREPLLNLLLAITRRGGLLDGAVSQGELYRRLIEQVYDRVHAAEGPRRLATVERVEFADYERFLWAIAEAAWHGAGRTATMEDVRRIASPRLLDRLADLTKGAEDPVSRLMTAFYFREHRGAAAEQKAFEFTHQSFAEYLLACRLIDFLELLDEERGRYDKGRGGWSPDEGAFRWYRLFGPAGLEAHAISFLEDAIRQHGADAVGRWQGHVAQILGRVVEQGFPVEQGERAPFVEETRRSGNAGGALLILASVCAQVSHTATSVPKHGFKSWLMSLYIPRYRYPYWERFRRHMGWLDLSGQNLTSLHLDGVTLSHGSLDGAVLVLSRISFSKLDRCSLVAAMIPGSAWLAVDLSEADLRDLKAPASTVPLSYSGRPMTVTTTFSGVCFNGANLAGADLSGAVFMDCVADERTIWPDDFDPIAAGIEIQ